MFRLVKCSAEAWKESSLKLQVSGGRTGFLVAGTGYVSPSLNLFSDFHRSIDYVRIVV